MGRGGLLPVLSRSISNGTGGRRLAGALGLMRRFPSIGALAILLSAPALARAQTSAAAELAFRQGRKLMNEGRYQEACPKFAESQRLDPAPGTQLNLADCYEKLGHTASAWETFRAAETAATASGQTDFASEARKRAEALEPRLCKLAITAEEKIDGLEVQLDGQPATALIGSAAPIDPGEHTVEARAPGKKDWRQPVRVVRPGVTVRVDIPRLEDVAARPPTVHATAPRPPPHSGARHGMTPLAWGLVIGAGAALAVGVGVDIVAYGDLRDCRDQGGCASQDDVDSIKTRFLVGDILVGAAIAGAGGAFLSYWFGGGEAERSVEVVAAPDGASLLMVGHF